MVRSQVVFENEFFKVEIQMGHLVKYDFITCPNFIFMDRYTDLTGMTFGRLNVIENAGYSREKESIMWKCICSCEDKIYYARGGDLRNGHTISCGCARLQMLREHRTTIHGLSKTPEYASWLCMMSRCYKPKNASYASYGGRGITVCERWRNKKTGFLSFLEDMGHKPTTAHTLDRFPDVNDNYYKENCRWGDVEQQANNKRTNKIMEYNGVKMTLSQLCRLLDININTLRHHLRAGHSVEYALECKAKYPQRGKDSRYEKGRLISM